MSEFRDVLHAWARRILEERSAHTGPFEIRNVWISHDSGSSISSESVEVAIRFAHADQAECPFNDGYGPPCTGEQVWTLFDTTDTVTMLNELLALAAAPAAPRSS